MTALLGAALLTAALAASVAVAPIWRRREGSAPRRVRRLLTAQTVTRAWRHRRASHWGPVAAGLLCGSVGLVGGAVVAGVLAAYGAVGFVLVRGIVVRRSRQRAYRLAADAVVGLAADLRAGAALAPAWRTAQEALRGAQESLLPGPAADEQGDVAVVTRRVLAATALADASGAPLAEVLDRLDAHLRAVDRARAVAHSQAAGARVSAGLLAAMPVAGVALGVVIGVDAAGLLLHTPAGALALGTAVALQVGGLAWAARLADAEVAP